LDSVQCLAHRPPIGALQADRLVDGAVQLEHDVRGRACLLVEFVDVLRDQRGELSAALEVDQRAVCRVRAGAPGRMVQELLPSLLSHFGTGHIGLEDRKSTRLNSSHVKISYAVFCLKKKTCTTSADG